MIHLKTKTALRRNAARLACTNRILDMQEPRTPLRSSGYANRHCAQYLQMARRAGYFSPAGGSRVRGEP